MKRSFLTNLKSILAIAFLSILTVSCTNLEIDETDSIIAEGSVVFEGVADVDASITNLYNDVYGQMTAQDNFYALQEVTTDEQLVPTRGTDWGDNGVWRTLHAHTWSPTHQYVNTVWNQLNQNVLRASQIIHPLSSPNAEQEAQARFLRAFSMYFVLDMWGIAPFREATDGPDVDPIVLSAAEAYQFIIDDLEAAIPNLPIRGPSDENLRANQAAGHFLLAKAVLNSERYTGTSPNYDVVIAAVNNIELDGYGLVDGYFDIFGQEIDNETIWYTSSSVGNVIWNGLHYNQNSPDNAGGGWNGFSTLAEFYDSFEGPSETNFAGQGQEERRGWVPDANTANEENLGIGYGFLVGQQYDEDGTILKDRSGNPLVFTKEFPGLSGNGENTGIRVIKYHPGQEGGSFRSHKIMFRYSDAYLMKAEAMMRKGESITAMINDLRTLRGATPLGNVTDADLLAERGRELYTECWRRNDMIRFGQFTRDWEFKNPESVNDSKWNLFPIPVNALLSNPNLVQNPGY